MASTVSRYLQVCMESVGSCRPVHVLSAPLQEAAPRIFSLKHRSCLCTVDCVSWRDRCYPCLESGSCRELKHGGVGGLELMNTQPASKTQHKSMSPWINALPYHGGNIASKLVIPLSTPPPLSLSLSLSLYTHRPLHPSSLIYICLGLSVYSGPRMVRVCNSR